MLLNDEIRLLDILPYGSDGASAPIHCETRVVALSDKPVYEVLSYRWGDPEAKRVVTLDNQQTFVTTKLHAALLRVRLEDKQRTIWIDQLCIDQDNLTEKAVQIRLMREIYTNCSQCLIWVDEINPTVPQADAEAIIDALNSIAYKTLPVPPCLASASAFHGPIQALKSISVGTHPWWNRIWTVQESILPANKVFLWGPLQLPWDTLAHCAYAWTGTSDNPAQAMWDLLSKAPPKAAQDIRDILGHLFCNVIWIDSAHQQRDTPVATTAKWRGRQATEPRDKVFGLLGLLPRGMELYYTDRCDYTTPTVQVYSAFTLDMILHARGLFPLVIEPRAPPGKGTEGVPRWACDMDCTIPYQVDAFYRYWGYRSYDACAGRELDKKALHDAAAAAADAERPMQTLGLTGVLAGTIEMIGTKLPHQNTIPADNVVLEKIASTMRSWMSMARKYHEGLANGLSGEQFEEAFYRVMVSDRVRDGNQWTERPPNEQDLADISNFVRTGHGLINGLAAFWSRYVCNQTFFITESGMMGLGHLETEIGDQVWIFDGGKMPFTIRQSEGLKSGEDFDFVGCCYCHGIMDGELFNTDGQSKWVLQGSVLVH